MNLPAPPPGRPLVMGIVNVTPDSFSDGGRWADAGSALAHARELLAQGADIVDVGGESTRPGAARPDPAEELARVVPVVRGLAADEACVSVDTMRADVAQAAIDAGATIVNDVSGGLADPRMAQVVAAHGAPFVVMHWRGHSDRMQQRAQYDDVVAEVVAELADRVRALEAQGVRRDRLIVDPGLGFAKTAAHNWALLAATGRLAELGLPVLIGASRKNFLGTVGVPEGATLPPEQRDPATAAVSALVAQQDVWGVRVHDVRSTLAAVEVVRRVREAGR